MVTLWFILTGLDLFHLADDDYRFIFGASNHPQERLQEMYNTISKAFENSMLVAPAPEIILVIVSPLLSFTSIRIGIGL